MTLAVPSGYAPATVVNTANITVRPIVDPDLTNNSATDTDTVARSANLSITKTDSADPVVPGQAFTYTLTVANSGPSDAATLTVSDTVPAQFTVTNVTSPAGSCGFAGQVVTCTRPTLLNAATWMITVSVTTAAAAPGGTFTNTAIVSAATADPVPANNSASQPTTISVSADLAVTKSDGVASVVAGTSTNYTITLTNNGPSAVASGAVVSDPIPAGTVGSETEPNCAIAGSTFTCTTTAVLASGASVVYHLVVAVPANYAPATVVNTATITSSPATDPTPANNSATDTDTVTKSADLAIAKTDGVASVVAGTSTTYTITVSNAGPSEEPAGVVISDPIPAGTVGSESEPDCVLAAGAFTCTTASAILAGGSVTYQLTLAVAASFAPANLSNTASITSTPAIDPNGANNAATDTDSVTRSADLGDREDRFRRPRRPRTGVQLHAHRHEQRTVRCLDRAGLRHRARTVHRDQRDLAGERVRTRPQRSHVHAADAGRIRLVGHHGVGNGEPWGTCRHVHEHCDREHLHGGPGGRQRFRVTGHGYPSVGRPLDREERLHRPDQPGDALVYTIIVTNNGPSDAANLTVTDSIPLPAHS